MDPSRNYTELLKSPGYSKELNKTQRISKDYEELREFKKLRKCTLWFLTWAPRNGKPTKIIIVPCFRSSQKDYLFNGITWEKIADH